MITDIHSLVSNQAKGTTPTSSTSNLGALSKLSSELKFMEGMHPVKITSVHNAPTATGSSQLIGISRNDQQQFTLINTKPNATIQAGDTALLKIASNQSASLAVQAQAATPTASSTAVYPQSSSKSQTYSAPTKAADTNMISQTTSGNSTASQRATPPQNVASSAKVITDITIASRPISLTAISASIASTGNSTTTSSTQTNTAAAQTPPTPVAASQTMSKSTSSNSSHITQYSTQVTDGNRQFTLNTQHPLKAGETISVFLDKNNQVQLFPTQVTSTHATTLLEGLKQTLPKQITAPEFTAMVKQLHALSQTSATLPEKVSTALEQLIKQLPNLQSMTQSSGGVKDAMQTSGLFSEANLAAKTHLESDLKLNLTRLESAVTEASKHASPAALNTSQHHAFNLVSGAIERITTSQVRTMIESAQAQQDGSLLPLSMDIPIKDGRSSSVVNLQIDKDPSQAQEVEAHDRRWLVKLKFDFEETGRFEARTSIQGKKVGIVFAVEQAHTERMIRQRLDQLRDNLRKKEVAIETLDCFQAKLQEANNTFSKTKTTASRLIDVRT